MRERVLKQGTIWFRSGLLIQDPKTLPGPPDGSLPQLPTGKRSVGLEREIFQPKGKSAKGRQGNKKLYRQVCATSLS